MEKKSNIFNTVAVTAPNYSTFDLSHDHKTSLKMGELVPVLTQECLPGDVYNIQAQAMFRLMPMIAPILHRVEVTFHHFFVPNRILWENWEKWITGGETVGIVPPVHPIIDVVSEASSLPNYIGCPIVNQQMTVNALPFAAYQRIWHEYYRDQNLQPEEPIFLVDGQQFDNNVALQTIRKRAWEHDYFTSCLPFAQKGDAVELPLDFVGTADVQRKAGFTGDTHWYDQNSVVLTNNALYTDALTGYTEPYGVAGGTGADPSKHLSYDPNGSLEVEFDGISVTTTINDLRQAWALQQFLEKNARAGSRYTEALYAHYGVRSSDKRLQRPEYIGGAKGTIAVSEVLQTSSTDSTTPQGNMAGHGISVMGSGNSRFRCEEHGYIISILSVRPTTAYYQGLPRFLSKYADRTMIAFPDFAQLGEQEVLNKEVYYDTSDGKNNDTFGYIPRYAEYRYSPSRVTGQLATTLDFWHLGRKFTNRPLLNADFIQCNPSNRIFAYEATDEDTMVAQIYIQIRARRPLPVYGIPAPLV